MTDMTELKKRKEALNLAIHPKESALAEYPVKVEDGVVYIDTEGVSPLFASP